MRRPRRRVTETGDPEEVESPPGPSWVAVALVTMLGLMVLVAVAVVRVADRESSRPPVPQLLVPSGAGRTAEAATDALQRRGFVVDLQPEPNILAAPGTVVGQDPVAGSKLEQGSRVVLRVSSGPPGTRVPDLVGLQSADAVAALGDEGLRAEVVPVFSDRVRPGEVLSSSPRRDREVLPGSVVRVSVSQGPRPRTVPAVVGTGVAMATAEIARAGLTVGRITERVVAGTLPGVVLSATPGPGTQRPPKYPVALVVSVAPSGVEVPDLVGLGRAAASEVLDELGLRADLRGELVAAGDPGADRVLRQGVPPGTELPARSTVEVVVGVDPSAPPG